MVTKGIKGCLVVLFGRGRGGASLISFNYSFSDLTPSFILQAFPW